MVLITKQRRYKVGITRYNLAKQSAINCWVIIVKLRIRVGLVKAGKLVFFATEC
jgi:hypothetical protein